MKNVLEFAAKEITVGDSQASWQKWNTEQQQVRNESEADDEQRPMKKIQRAKWTRQMDSSTSQPYWIDSISGSVSQVEPNFVETTVEEEEEESKEQPTTTVQYQVPKAAPQPPQVWEVMINSLTRRPMWYCEQLHVTLHQQPPPEPWRAVREKESGQRVYFWNPETGETRD